MKHLSPPSSKFFADLNLVPLRQESKLSTLGLSSSILQQRIQLMGTDQENDWVQYLAWDNEEGHQVQLVLAGSRGFDSEEKLLGYTCVDQETYLAFVEITVHGIGRMYQTGGECVLWLRLCLVVDAESLELDWRLQAISMTNPQEFLGPRLALVDSLQELESSGNLKIKSQTLQSHLSRDPAQEDELDGYWDQYDKEDPEVTSEPDSEAGSEDYYERYTTQVETAIQAPEASQLDEETERHTQVEQQSLPALLPDIVHHAETSLRSLRRLCHAAALTDDQVNAIFRKVMDEAL